MSRLVCLVLVCYVSAVLGHIALTGNPNTRENAHPIGDNKRYPNPAEGWRFCHGAAKGRAVTTVRPGQSLQWGMGFGVDHGGGHCAMFISVDERTLYKINDVIDCTLPKRMSMVVPANAPRACATQTCTLSWLWVPRHSGACEVYQNCIDVKIPGATGGIESNFVVKWPPTCHRINAQARSPSLGINGVRARYLDTLSVNEFLVDGDIPTGYHSVPPFSHPALDNWCNINCNSGFCPPSHCAAGAESLFDANYTTTDVYEPECVSHQVQEADNNLNILERYDYLGEFRQWQTWYLELNKLSSLEDQPKLGAVVLIPGDCNLMRPDSKFKSTILNV